MAVTEEQIPLRALLRRFKAQGVKGYVGYKYSCFEGTGMLFVSAQKQYFTLGSLSNPYETIAVYHPDSEEEAKKMIRMIKEFNADR